MLISGVPGTGKSYFGRWLAEHRGAFTVDIDHGGIDAAGLRLAWDAFRRSLDAREFVEQLSRGRTLCALVWGFPMHHLEVVQALGYHGGITPWWFTGDRTWARKYFCDRGDPGEHFDQQYQRIELARQAIGSIFGGCIVPTVAADGTRMPCEEIYRRIFGKP